MATTQPENRHPVPEATGSIGDLIALIPAHMGFYPEESLIIFGFMPVDENTCTLGPTYRFDLADAASIPAHAARQLHRCAMFLGVAITRRSASDPWLLRTLAECPIDFCGVWQLDEIVTGGAYQPVPIHPNHPALRAGWDGGVLPEIMNTPAMAPFIASGELPALNREEAYGRFASVYRAGISPLRDAEELATYALSTWVKAISTPGQREEKLREVHDDALAAFARIEKNGLTADDLLYDTDHHLCPLRVPMAEAPLRDAVIAALYDHPRGALAAMRALARLYQGDLRANALALYALAAATCGMQAFAAIALMIGEAEAPDHTLLRLLNKAHRQGRLAEAMQAGRKGADDYLAGSLEDSGPEAA